ncbi:unnamed protein product [Adineta ricciae]|uniref:Uncharacterized protein n=1 Tax=Adineta ricciae TaxID=249248 RepID=A0A814GBC5_ADIRI|nr:unnamed protein product [Adineta ricciae]
MSSIFIGIVFLLNMGYVYSHTPSVRETKDLDSTLKKPILNALMERIEVDTSWEESMLVAPMTIQLLAQLLIVSSTKEVSLRAFSPNRTFTYIQRPDSFRATLLQLSHEGYKAFLSGDSTMHMIQLRMIQIPKHIRTALKLLAGKFPQRTIARLLPRVLKNIEDTEVIQSTAETESNHIQHVEQNEREMQVLREQKEGLEKQEKIRAEYHKQATEAANRAESVYYKALNDIPTGYKAILRDFVGGMLKAVNLAAESAAFMLSGFTGRRSSGSSAGGAAGFVGNNGGQTPLSFGLSETLAMADKFSNTLTRFKNSFFKNNSNIKQLESYGTAFKMFREFIADLPDNSAKSRVLELISRSEQVAKQAVVNAKLANSNNETNTELEDELTTLVQQSTTFQAANQFSDPRMASQSLSTVGNGNGASDSSQNEIFKAQIAQSTMTELRRRQDEQAAEYMKLLDHLHKTQARMVSLDLTTMHYKEIIAMLNEAFKLLSRIDEQWKKFVHFFTKMSIYITDMIKGPLRRFLQVAGEGQELEHALRMDLIDVLKEDTFGIHREAYVLYVMSKTYYEVSSKHLMRRLEGLSGMLNARSTEERIMLVQRLQSQTNETLDQINALIRERKETFNQEFNKRNTELTTLINHLGGPNINAQQTIDEARRIISQEAPSGKDTTVAKNPVEDDDTVWGDK